MWSCDPRGCECHKGDLLPEVWKSSEHPGRVEHRVVIPQAGAKK